MNCTDICTKIKIFDQLIDDFYQQNYKTDRITDWTDIYRWITEAAAKKHQN